jgi:hypothetical protein
VLPLAFLVVADVMHVQIRAGLITDCAQEGCQHRASTAAIQESVHRQMAQPHGSELQSRPAINTMLLLFGLAPSTAPLLLLTRAGLML